MVSQETLIKNLITEGYLKTPRIIDAFRAVDRADFVLNEYKSEAYGNYPLPIGYGQTISQPLTVAFMLELLHPQPGEKILDIGMGSGWQTALLAHIVQQQETNNEERGRVDAVEIIPELCRFGEENMRKYNFLKKGAVKLYCQNASTALPEGPYDKIIAAATASNKIPEEWREKLNQRGILVAPVGGSLLRYTKTKEGGWKEEEYPGFVFVPLV